MTLYLKEIFKTFCCNFYGSPIWDINSPGFRKICTTWNIGVRTVLKLPFDAHSYFLGPLLRQNHIRHQLQVRSIIFLYNMYYSNNIIVCSCFNHAFVNVNLCIGAKLAFLQTSGVDIFKHKLCDAIKHVPQSKIIGYEPADLTVHPPPKRSRVGSFFSHRCLVSPKCFPQRKSGFCRRYSH